MKHLIVGQSYKLDGMDVTYAGRTGVANVACAKCGKLRNCHIFVEGPIDNPQSQLFYGSECLKQVLTI
jgi:hypothetical protein